MEIFVIAAGGGKAMGIRENPASDTRPSKNGINSINWKKDKNAEKPMSGKNIFTAALLGMALLGTTAFSGERTIPVDIFLMVDKSLSMAEDGKFDGLHTWVTGHRITSYNVCYTKLLRGRQAGG